ncbi:MAG TPA: CHAT domain-containing protein [Enhygromyxa sp.]|nr:CHAT domain-containing protein [Enhygromyxa sp.]
MAARARHLRGLWARLRPPLAPELEREYRDLLSQHQERKQAIAARLQDSWRLSTAELEAARGQLRAESDRADKLLIEATALLEQGAPTWSCERSLAGQPGEAVLVMAPSSDGRSWIAMFGLRDDSGELTIETMRVDLARGGPDAAADAILDKFTAGFERAREVRIIPVGAFMPVEFHRLWFARGQQRPVITYSLGLGTALDTNDAWERTAAVVAGSSDLDAVAREAVAVGTRLQDLDWTVSSRWSLDELVQPSLLHYAGHGAGGSGLGWDSAIELPEIGRVSAARIVAGQRSPRLVVLGACSAARVSSEAIDGGMNLAAAFLLAGAQLVIAPTRDVDDDAAYQLGVSLYRDLGDANPEELSRALSRVQREQLVGIAAPTGTKTFSAWRAWTP